MKTDNTLFDDREILVLTNDETKRCGRCHHILPTTSFHRRSKSPDHLQNWCIRCKKEYQLGHKMAVMSSKSDILNGFDFPELIKRCSVAPKYLRRHVTDVMYKTIKLIENA